MRRLLVGIALPVVLLAPGCGGGSSSSSSSSSKSDKTADESAEAGAVRDALKAYTAAVVADNTRVACSLLTPNAQHEAAQTVPGAGSCQKAHELAYGKLSQEKRQQAIDQVAGVNPDVKLNGTTAILTQKGSGRPLRLRKLGGAWKIDESPVVAPKK